MVSRKGFVWALETQADPGNTSPELSTYPNVVDVGTLVNGPFNTLVEGLSAGTTYYYRAFGYDDMESLYVYGAEASFTTLDVAPATAAFNQGDILQSKPVAILGRPITQIIWSELNFSGDAPVLEVTNDDGSTWHEVEVDTQFTFPNSSAQDVLKYRITASAGPCVVSAPIKIQVN